MKAKWLCLAFAFSGAVLLNGKPAPPPAAEYLLSLSDIRVRDPFILADRESQTYYLYAQGGNRARNDDADLGVEVYRSRDLVRWSAPKTVFERPKEGFWGRPSIWAPEVHKLDGVYYMFASFGGRAGGRGTQILRNFSGSRLPVFHQPNSGDRERAQIYRIKEADDLLVRDGRWTAPHAGAQDNPGMIIQTNTHPKPTRLQVSANGRFLQYADGTPFFYLADTAWMLPNKLTEEEARRLFADRSAKGFTVIQSLIFRDLFVPNSANVHGVRPFASEADMHAAKLNPKWLDWVVRITRMAAEHGLVMAWLPTWGDKWTERNNSAGPVIFDEDSKAEAYGRDLSEALKECDNVIWVLGGDSDIETPAQADIIRAMARGLRSGASRGSLITFHPAGGRTSAPFSSEDWLDINTLQSGHQRLNTPNYRLIETLYNTLPTKPCLDIESNYEWIPVGTRRQNGIPPGHRAFIEDYDVRRSYYRSVLAGAAGFAYGCEPIRQIYRAGDRSHAWDGQGIQTWEEGLAAPGSSQLQLLKRLLLDRSYFTRIPDRGLLREVDNGGNDDPVSHIAVARCSAGGYILVYVPIRQMLAIDTSVLPAKRLRISEYDPEAGVPLRAWEIENSGIFRHIPSRRLDTLLVIDAIDP